MLRSIGIVREHYNKWERRTPLTPSDVKKLVQKGVQVAIQPCDKRIFPNREYQQAGATLTDDLSASSVICGIKQVPQQELIDERTYLFFSHTTKAQAENMPLLRSILDKQIQLIDYECIVDPSTRKRKIAFGKFAGTAGMINTFRGVGERLLAHGYSTPFLNVSSAFMYGDLEKAQQAVKEAGKQIHEYGLPQDISPMTFVFTGNGNVSKGAQEIFKLMPHKMIQPSELEEIATSNDASGNLVYGCVVNENDMVRHKDGRSSVVESDDYYANPQQYEPIFHTKIAPYTSVLMNCMYWDERFPRLLTKDQIHDLYQEQQSNLKLLAVGDITCDKNGSVEFLDHITSIENPFYLYNARTGVTESSLMNSEHEGVMMMGVDILPTELARESSQHFSSCLMPIVETIVESQHNQQPLPDDLQGAVITQGGRLTQKYEYIGKLEAKKASLQHDDQKPSTQLLIQGHLFDTGLINQILNVIESKKGEFQVLQTHVQPNTSGRTTVSRVLMELSTETLEELDEIVERLHTLCQDTPYSNATVNQQPIESLRTNTLDEEQVAPAKTFPNQRQPKRVVCLGAGLVVAPMLEYLSRDENILLEVVSPVENEAKNLTSQIGRSNVVPHQLDAINDQVAMEEFYASADCVVSLLPATMHVEIAKQCIRFKVPLVTASYVSPEMKALHEEAKEQGIPILCEMGLDPGMDHMSAMKVIHEVQSSGGKVLGFSSVCGGLPSPEAADNPFGYKFSWSPRGVLTAAQNDARYLHKNEIVEVAGNDLLSTSRKVDFLPALSLEELPNRNAFPYGDIYGISDTAHSIFRGTLRYAGWCNTMFQCKQLGLLDSTTTKVPDTTWQAFLAERLKQTPNVQLDMKTQDCFHFLGFDSPSVRLNTSMESIMDAFCIRLQEKLPFQSHERDLAIMHHSFDIATADDELERRTSTFIGYGESNGKTIMAKTVGLTAAIGVELLLNKCNKTNGVLLPTTPELYEPGLKILQEEGITFSEKTAPGN